MGNFEIVLTLSIIQTQRLTGEGEEMQQNDQKTEGQNLNGFLLIKI